MSRDRLCVCGHAESEHGQGCLYGWRPNGRRSYVECDCDDFQPAALTDCDPGDETPEIRAQPDAHEGII